MTRVARLLSAVIVVCMSLAACADDGVKEEVIPLWPNGAPGAKGNHSIDRPTLTLFPAAEGKRTGGAVIVCPGGGYGGHAMTYEGYDVARWFNSLGVSAYVLQYRVSPYRHPIPLGDLQRAIRLVRSHAEDWKIDPKKVGILGFSAGGHLCSTASTHFDSGNPKAEDPIDRQSCRPDLAILCYPVISFTEEFTHKGSRSNLLGANPDPELVKFLSSELQVTSETPPTFLFHTDGDTGVPPENSTAYYLALRKAKVTAELHIFKNGPHGVGLGNNKGMPNNPFPELAIWPKLCESWLKNYGFVGP
ncbi:MAG: alpha/beta hydrolase [Planctomycetaceae bacterium]|nr:alpha/beta hydrolase [Planctomycetaceae bacterium]